MAEIVTQINERPVVDCIFYNATTGAARNDLTVNVTVYDVDGSTLNGPTAASEANKLYTYVWTTDLLDAVGDYDFTFTPTDTTNVSPVERHVIVGVEEGSYQAKVWLADDDGGVTDRYIARWFKNGEPYGTATATTIQVIKSADGSNLIAATSMPQIGSTPRYRYDASGAERITDGAGYIVIVSATIDGAARTWEQPVSRDS